MKKRKHRSPDEWEAIHQDWQNSGLSIAQFCNKIGISPQSLYNYRQRRDDFKPAKPKKNASSFIELGALASTQAASNMPLEIILSLGHGIELTIRRPS